MYIKRLELALALLIYFLKFDLCGGTIHLELRNYCICTHGAFLEWCFVINPTMHTFPIMKLIK